MALGTSVGVLLGEVTAPSESHEISVHPSLVEYAKQASLSQAEVHMLARIRYRGRQPRTADDWHLLHESIKRLIRGGS